MNYLGKVFVYINLVGPLLCLLYFPVVSGHSRAADIAFPFFFFFKEHIFWRQLSIMEQAPIPSDLNLEEIRDTLVSIAFEAGRMILAANPNAISTGTKLNCLSLPRDPPPLSMLIWN